jgi:hypothetical protein
LGNGHSDGYFEAGVNVARSHDAELSLSGDLMPSFSGDRLLYGGDFRLAMNEWLLSGEFIGADLEPSGSETMKPLGYHLTAGYMVSQKSQLLARWDSLDAEDLYTSEGKTDWIVLGFNHWPTKATELQVNHIIDVDDVTLEHNQWLVNLQVVF